MNAEQAHKLREPFPPAAIGKLPKGGVMLDYVGHAATTDRLLQVDPEWSWEPFALDELGLPALDPEGNLWIRLTVCGVTRPGVGDGKTMKERIGDAIRNAAMRFGVALDLWAKEDLQGEGQAPPALAPGQQQAKDLMQRQKERIQARADAPDNGRKDEEIPFGDEPAELIQHADLVITHKQRRHLFAVAREHGVSEDHLRDLVEEMTGTPSTKELKVGAYEQLVALVESREVTV